MKPLISYWGIGVYGHCVNAALDVLLPVAVVDIGVEVQSGITVEKECGIVFAEIEAWAIVGVAQHLTNTSLAAGSRSLRSAHQLIAIHIRSQIAFACVVVEEVSLLAGLHGGNPIRTGDKGVAGARAHLHTVRLSDAQIIMITRGK